MEVVPTLCRVACLCLRPGHFTHVCLSNVAQLVDELSTVQAQLEVERARAESDASQRVRASTWLFLHTGGLRASRLPRLLGDSAPLKASAAHVQLEPAARLV
eukprot:1910933-Pleurochrysis_carterae.AAC.1